jgi:choice-of-anchor B domain-containing protein
MVSRKYLPLLVLALAAVCVRPLSADDGVPRYVSGAGRDQGDCANKFRPCRTLGFAIARAGKGDMVWIAEGNYAVRNTEELLQLLTMKGRLQAGYNGRTGFADRNAGERTVLVGVPPQLRERFEQAGFTVLVDTKGLEADEHKSMQQLAAAIAESEKSHPAANCLANSAAGFPCQAVSLLAHLSLQDLLPSSSRGNDVWGFTDLNTGREYAFMGLQNGVAVIDVSNPQVPEQIAFAAGSATTWRDIKVYQRYDAAAKRWRAYAYASADQVPDLPIILDLSALPNGVERVNFAADFRAAHNIYLVDADYSFGLPLGNAPPQLSVAGAGVNGGNYRLYSLAQPRAPQLLRVSTTGYAHDTSSFVVADQRKATQCADATAPRCQAFADFNENTVDIWDVTNAAAPTLLARQSYPNASYVHSGWWTEDGRFLLVHDELDEMNAGLNTTVRVLDMANLRAPVLAGSWTGPTRAIDHNGFVKGNRYYVANYAEGLTVLDLTDPRAPARLGYFDTFPTSSQPAFVGAWGVYPFFASGTLAVADINSGLYLLRNETLDSVYGTLSMARATLNANEGQTIQVAVQRSGGTHGAASVQLELLHATTDAGDAELSTTQVNWADGDGGDKTATLTLANDALAEDMDLLMVRLKNPQGGATLNYPDTSFVYLTEGGKAPRIHLLDATVGVDQRRGKAIVTVLRTESLAGTARISYRTLPNTGFSGFTPQQGELVWLPGDAAAKIVSVDLNTAALPAGQSGTFQVEFFAPSGADLEANGSVATTTLANVTVNNTDVAPPPAGQPTPSVSPAPKRGGGGAMDLWLLVFLNLAVGTRLTRSAR